MCRYFDGQPHVRGLLSDQAWCAWAALSAFEATGDTIWLRRASELVDAAEELFDASAGAYRDRLADASSPGRLIEPAFPLDDNALVARVCQKLAALSGDAARRDRARVVLESNAESYRAYGMFAAAYGSAVLDWFHPAHDVVIVGRPSDSATVALRETARRAAFGPVTVNVVDPNDTSRLAALGHSAEARPTAFVCDDRSCFVKTSDDRELETALSQAAARM